MNSLNQRTFMFMTSSLGISSLGEIYGAKDLKEITKELLFAFKIGELMKVIALWGRKLNHRREFALALMLAVLMMIGALSLSFLGGRRLNVSAIVTSGNIGVYWDRNCTKRISSFDWGVLSPGQTRKFYEIYVRNEGTEPFSLVLTPKNWSPASASIYMSFSCFFRENVIEAGRAIKVRPILTVSNTITGISSFSFNIFFEARPSRSATIGDFGGGNPMKFFAYDGLVDWMDLRLFLECYNDSAPPEVMYLCDLGGFLDGSTMFFAYDGKVDARDFRLFIQCYNGLTP